MTGAPGTSVSVIVPSYNEGPYLLQTVDSLLAGLPADGELIVVDDHSTDGSAESLPGRDPRLRRLRPRARLGAVASRNLGAAQARGQLLVFSDAHVTVPGGWAEEFAAVLRRRAAGVAGAVIVDMEHPDSKGYGLRFVDHALTCAWGGRLADRPFPVPLVGAGFMAIRRRLFEELGGFDGGMSVYGMEDPDLDLRLWTYGYECLVVPDVEAAHLFRPEHDFQHWTDMLHNMLRLGIVHFSRPRLRRLIEALAANPYFAAASARVLVGDAWARREEVQAGRRYDDDWYFRRFPLEA